MKKLILFISFCTLLASTAVQAEGDRCDCDQNVLTGLLDTSAIERIWAPLKDKNNDLFQKIFANLDQIKQIDSVFDSKTNDTKYMAYTMYILKTFADLGDRKIDQEDIQLVLEILKDGYNLNIPPVVFNIIDTIESIEIKSMAGGAKKIKIYNKGKKDTRIDLTQPGLLGDQSGQSLQLQTFNIDHGASIVFRDDKWRGSKKVGSKTRKLNVHSLVDSFLDKRGMGTKKIDSFPKDELKRVKNFAKKRNYPLSPLYVQFKGLEAKVISDGDDYSPEFNEAIVLPGMDLTAGQKDKNKSIKDEAKKSHVSSLFLRVEVQYGILSPDIELPM